MKKSGLNRNFGEKLVRMLFVLAFWILIWELVSVFVGQEILLASPAAVFRTLFVLVLELDFWKTILFSSLRIVAGFVLALFAGTLFAALSYRFRLIEDIISPFMKTIKAMPVASFIILALVWIRSENLSVLISFMMVVPMFYSSVYQGLAVADEKLLQMVQVFHVSLLRRLTAIYLPSVKPFFLTAVTVGLGFCWKAGIAAEVIGVPTGSIGEKLYEAKLYFMTKELMAWTIVIILISMMFEKLVVSLLQPERRP